MSIISVVLLLYLLSEIGTIRKSLRDLEEQKAGVDLAKSKDEKGKELLNYVGRQCRISTYDIDFINMFSGIYDKVEVESVDNGWLKARYKNRHFLFDVENIKSIDMTR